MQRKQSIMNRFYSTERVKYRTSRADVGIGPYEKWVYWP